MKEWLLYSPNATPSLVQKMQCYIQKEKEQTISDLLLKEAATYFPTTKCSIIGVSELNFSVRDGKRWDLTAITT